MACSALAQVGGEQAQLFAAPAYLQHGFTNSQLAHQGPPRTLSKLPRPLEPPFHFTGHDYTHAQRSFGAARQAWVRVEGQSGEDWRWRGAPHWCSGHSPGKRLLLVCVLLFTAYWLSFYLAAATLHYATSAWVFAVYGVSMAGQICSDAVLGGASVSLWPGLHLFRRRRTCRRSCYVTLSHIAECSYVCSMLRSSKCLLGGCTPCVVRVTHPFHHYYRIVTQWADEEFVDGVVGPFERMLMH